MEKLLMMLHTLFELVPSLHYFAVCISAERALKFIVNYTFLVERMPTKEVDGREVKLS